MRTYGRINGVWEEVDPDANGFNDPIYLTTLVQCLKLSPGESPFYSNYGIPAQTSVIQQVLPTFYVNQLQQQFAPKFASLIISIVEQLPPTYKIDALTNSGSSIVAEVAV